MTDNGEGPTSSAVRLRVGVALWVLSWIPYGSFGSLIAEKLLGQGQGAGAVAIDPAQIKGVLPLPLAQLRAALPALGSPANLHKAVALTGKEFRFGFGNALSEEESDELFDRWTIPSPAKPLFQAAVANFSLHSPAEVDTANESRGPLLLISGTADHTVPDRVTRSTLKQYRGSSAVTELKQFVAIGAARSQAVVVQPVRADERHPAEANNAIRSVGFRL